jgi:SAM-dependent methyltransferase
MGKIDKKPWEEAYRDMLYWKWPESSIADWSIPSAVGFMERALKLEKGARVLDLGCALGYHSIELARRGYDVTGLELSEAFLEVARQRAEKAGVAVKLVQGDMIHLTFAQEFDAVVLWGNTFGLFRDEDNFDTLRGMAQALKKGGLALIDTQNYTKLPDKLEKGWVFSREDKNLLFLTKGTKDVLRARFGFTVIAIDLASGKRHEMPFSWRLYLLPELKRLAADAGLNLIGIYGDDPKFVDWKSWRRGEPDPYSMEGFTAKASKRILLCQV